MNASDACQRTNRTGTSKLQVKSEILLWIRMTSRKDTECLCWTPSLTIVYGDIFVITSSPARVAPVTKDVSSHSSSIGLLFIAWIRPHPRTSPESSSQHRPPFSNDDPEMDLSFLHDLHGSLNRLVVHLQIISLARPNTSAANADRMVDHSDCFLSLLQCLQSIPHALDIGFR